MGELGSTHNLDEKTFGRIWNSHHEASHATAPSVWGKAKMEKFLQLIWMAGVTTVDGSEIQRSPPGMYNNLVNNGMNYLSTGAGFFPSTVCAQSRILWIQLGADLWEFHRPRGNLVQGALKFLWIITYKHPGNACCFFGVLSEYMPGWLCYVYRFCVYIYNIYIYMYIYVYIYICIFTSITKHKVWLYIFFTSSYTVYLHLILS